MLHIEYLILLDGHNMKKKSVSENSIAFGKSTSQRIYSKHTHTHTQNREKTT